MKKIDDYRTLLEVDESTNLKTLKTAYRNLMKEWHPDKFHSNSKAHTNAEAKSKQLIEAYHFLVSIAPETMEHNMQHYMEIITTATIVDYQYKGLTLKIDFSDGNSYEYFDVPKAIYVKLHNADTQSRFARRHICTSYVFRNTTKTINV